MGTKWVFAPTRQPEPECDYCKGAGWVADRSRGPTDVRLVRCPNQNCLTRQAMERDKTERLFGAANIPLLYATASLADVQQDNALRTQVEEALAAGKSLIFRGKAGTGKTFYAAAILRSVINGGRVGRFCIVPDLLDRIRHSYNEPGHGNSLLEAVELTPFLVLDDLGTEKLTEWVSEKLYQLVNARVVNQRQTLYTTNLNAADLLDRFGTRLASRISGEVVRFTGPDRRVKT